MKEIKQGTMLESVLLGREGVVANLGLLIRKSFHEATSTLGLK